MRNSSTHSFNETMPRKLYSHCDLSQVWQCPNSALQVLCVSDAFPIAHAFFFLRRSAVGSVLLLLSLQYLPPSLTLSRLKVKPGQDKKFFFSIWGTGVLSKSYWANKMSNKIEGKHWRGAILCFSPFFLLFYDCAQRERPRASVTFTCSPRPMKLNLTLEGFFICRAIR